MRRGDEAAQVAPTTAGRRGGSGGGSGRRQGAFSPDPDRGGSEGGERGGASGGLVPDPDWIGRGERRGGGGVRVVGLGFVSGGGYGSEGCGRLGRWPNGPACWAEAQWGGLSLFSLFFFCLFSVFFYYFFLSLF